MRFESQRNTKQCFVEMSTLHVVAQQLWWMCRVTSELVLAMGVGARWVFMTIRVILFGLLVTPHFIAVIVWYIISPSVIRRVAYRTSRTTKTKHLRTLVQVVRKRRMRAESNSPDRDNAASAEQSEQQHQRTSDKLLGLASSMLLRIKSTGELSARNLFQAPHVRPDFANKISADNSAATSESESALSDDEATRDEQQEQGIKDEAALLLNKTIDGTSTHSCLREFLREATARTPKRVHQNPGEPLKEPALSCCNPSSSSSSSDASSDSESEGDSVKQCDDDDIEDKMNLHNRATLDIFLPCPLDELLRIQQRSFSTNRSSPNLDGMEPSPTRCRTPTRRSSRRKILCDQSPSKMSPTTRHVESTLFQNSAATSASTQRATTKEAAATIEAKKFPIVICVSGGAWIIGSHFWSALMAKLLAARGFLVFCPDYRNFPQSNMGEMTRDVSDAIGWIIRNAERYHGDIDNVTLIGQSAGAHLSWMSLISQARLAAAADDAKVPFPNHLDEVPPSESLLALSCGGVPSPPPLSRVYQVSRYNPRLSIHNFISLSGIYDLPHLLRHFHSRGLYRKVLYQVAGGKERLRTEFCINKQFDSYEAHRHADSAKDGADSAAAFAAAVERLLLSESFAGATVTGLQQAGVPSKDSEVLRSFLEYLPRSISFLHGDKDCSAPYNEPVKLYHRLKSCLRHREESHESVSPLPQVRLVKVVGGTHTNVIVEELLCGKSCVVEWMTKQRRAEKIQRREMRKTGGRQRSVSQHSESGSESGDSDADTLQMAIAPRKAPMILKFASFVCPF